MPNSSAFTIANTCLLGCGLAPIASAAVYPNVTDKYQKQMTIMLQLVQAKMSLRMNKRFNIRKFSFKTQGPDANGVITTSYPVKGATIEGFKANSFFNITTNGVYDSRIRMMTYEYWRMTWPRPDETTMGPPLHIIPMDDDGSGICRVMVWPYSDQQYIVEGQCRVICPQITDGNTQVIFPPHYEHVLILKGMEMLETRLNEGREQAIGPMADEAIAEVMQDASGAYEEEDPMDLGLRLYTYYPRDTTRDYNPLTDIPGPYP